MALIVLIFYAFFSLVFLGLNYLFLWRTFSYFHLPYALAWSVAATLFFFVSNALQETLNNSFSFFLHKLAGIWLGIVWLGLFAIVLVELARLIYPKASWGYVLIGIILILTGVALHTASSWVVFEHQMASEKITEQVRIVHLTDQHLHGAGAQEEFDTVIDLVKPLKPDVVVITGDLFDAPGRPAADAFSSLQTLGAPVLFTIGNHEFYVGDDWTEKVMQNLGADVLRTKSTTVKGIQFLGIDDPTGGASMPTELEQLDLEDTFRVLLYHQPDPIQPAVDNNIDLMLTGHTHAGQIFPFNLLVMLRYKYWKGLYTIGNTQLYVNPGTGTWMIPMRLGSRNTIGVFDIIPKGS
ncbi:MAG: metallophosphoesterase [Candidatus Woesearchaeota archaeon]|nr:metallophosphoesterase [Candidatus Woesearchaeota archaeon]